MGLMQKLRSSTKYIIWLVIISFGLLWGLSDTQVFDAMMAGPREMGDVNRESISYAEFNQRVNMLTEQHREETGASPDSEIRAQYEEMAWEQLVVDKILQQRMEEMGIAVTDRELIEMVTGENPDPFIRQQFTREDGTIDRAALQNAIESPENREIWLMIEQQLREQRRQQKLNQYIESSLRVSDFEVDQYYKRQNSNADFSYVRFPYSDIPRDEIQVTDSDIETYYNNNQHRFQRDKAWEFSYVTFSIAPTEEDTARIINNLADLREDFRQADDAERFLGDYFSETSYFDSYLSPGEVRYEHLRVFELEAGEVTEPYLHNNRAHMIRLLEERPSDETYVRVRQIQLQDNEQGRVLASDILDRARQGESFEGLAMENSRHSASAARGGDVGYISPDDRPENVSSAIFGAEAGSVIGPVDGEDGIYVFQIVDRTNRDVRFADLSRDVEADPFETVQLLANEAEDFQYFAESDGFFEEAERSEYTVEEAVATEGSPFIPGLGQSRVLVNEMERMEEGEVSDVIETEERFMVFHIDEIIPEGTRPLEEVRSQVENLVREQKRQELLTERVSEMLQGAGSLEELAAQNDAEIEQASGISMNQSNVSGAGREPKLVGAAFSLPLQQLSPAIDGNNAVFALVVENRTMADPAEMASAERQEIREVLQQRKNESFGSVWQDRIKAGAEIRDFRTQQRMMQPTM